MALSGPPVEGVDQDVEPRGTADLPPPGWYRDPTDRDKERWWTGDSWSESVRHSIPAPPAGWYPDRSGYGTGHRDPAQEHEWRWWDGASWSAWVSDEGEVGEDPVAGWQPPPLVLAGPERNWSWVVGALVAALALLPLLLWALYWAGRSQTVNVTLPDVTPQTGPLAVEPYWADLTSGHGDFPTSDSAVFATSYGSDGYHLVIKEPGTFAPATIRSVKAPDVVSVEIAATAVVVPTGAAFGPYCGGDPNAGYSLLIDGSGSPQLVWMGNSVLATGPPTAATPGQFHRLRLTCSETGDSNSPETKLEGYVDGAKVIETTDTTATVSGVPFTGTVTGIAGRTADGAPAEWVVAEFSRS